MRKLIGILLLFAIIITSLFVSCKNEPELKYTTPTAVGRIVLDSGVSANPGDFYIQVSETGNQFKTNSDGSWAVTGLDQGKEYTLYFSTKPFSNNIARSISDYVSFGAKKDHVSGQIGNGRDYGTIVIKQNGAISGKITLNDSPEDYSGVDIVIPGTSFTTKTDIDGLFVLADVPEGTYTIKISKTGYETITVDNVKVTITGDNTTRIQDIELKSGQGIITGSVGYNGLIAGNNIPRTTITLVSAIDNSVIARAEADSNTGEFSLYKIFPGSYKLQIQGEDCPLYEETIEVKPGVITSVGKKMLSVSGGRVDGLVKDGEGNPVENAIIQVSSVDKPFRFTTQSSEDGSFRIEGCISGENSLEISKLGYGTETRKVNVMKESSINIGEIKLYIESAVLKGRCVLTGESNNSGIVIGVKNTKTGNTFNTVSKEDGSFEITGINVVGTYIISYAKTGFKSASSLIDIAEFGKVYTAEDMILDSAYGTLKGRITLHDGSSAEGIAILLESKDGETRYNTVTNVNGNYYIEKILPGTYNMTVSKDGYDSQTELGITVTTSENKIVDSIVLKAKTRTIKGAVKLNNSSNYSGVAVTATNMNRPEMVYSAITNSDGSYYMNNIEAGKYIVAFNKERYISPEAVIVDLKTELEVTVETKTMNLAVASITGKIKANGLVDHSGIIVKIVHSEDAENVKTTVTDASGYYAFTDLIDAGTYILTASKDDFVSSSPKSVNVVNGEVAEVEEIVLISSYAMMSGRFTLVDNKMDNSGIKVHIEMEDGTNALNTETNREGEYSFTKVIPGTYKITASKDGYDNVEVLGVVVAESEVKDIAEKSLPVKTRTISGNIKLSGQESHAGISVVISNVSTAEKYTTETNSEGDFSVSSLARGKYSVTITKEGYKSPDVQVVDLTSVLEKSITGITLEVKEAAVSGRVELEGSSNHGGATVTITSVLSGREYTAVTKNDGSFLITGITEYGQYNIVVSCNTFITSNPVAVEVQRGKVSDAGLITLKSSLATVSGNVTLKNASSHEGISIKLIGSSEYSTTTDAVGNYTIGNVEAGTYRIEYSKDGYFTVVDGAVAIKSAEKKVLEEVVLDISTRTIFGNVQLLGRDNHAGITVTVTNIMQSDIVYSSQTNSQGDYYIDNIIAGTYSVTFHKDGYKEASTMVNLLNMSSVEVEQINLESIKAMVHGIVVLEGCSDYSGVLVTLSNSEGKIYQAHTLENGSFTVADIDEYGEYSVSISKDGYITDSSRMVTVVMGEITNIETVTLHSSLSIVKGRIILDGMSSHEGVLILLKSLDDENIQYTSSTSYDGSYVFVDVKSGKYSLIASIGGYQSATVNGIIVNESSEKIVEDLHLAIATKWSARGKVELEFKTNHAGAQVIATNVEFPTLIYSALTNSDGYFSLTGLNPGFYNIVVSYADYMTYSYPTIEVTSDNSVELNDVKLLKSRGVITGVVKKEGFVVHSGIKVELVGTEFTALTNAEGVYTISVPTDVYTGGLRFSAHNYELESYTGTISILTEKTVSIPTKELKATHVSPVYGKVEVKGFPEENVGIPVRIENLEGFETVTGEGGLFSFEDVPLGNYKVRFEKDNAPVKIVDLAAVPSDGIDLGTVSIIPNAANIEGYVGLTGLDSHNGIKVTVTEKTRGTSVSTVTDRNGFFRITNIASGSTHTITFEKDGWTSSQMEISGLSPLETRAVSAEGEVMLIDETSPVLSSVTINNGSHTSAEKLVQIALDAEDNGSGLAKMQYCFDGVFDRTVTMHDYNGLFEIELPEGNGDKTVYVKVYDLAGNESEIKSATVTLTDQKTEVSGVLGGDKLLWTKDMSPYLVTGNLLVESGKELIIDPGVEVQFDGPYYMQVEGKITAIGTESEKIQFHGINSGLNAWKGINVKTNTGSKFDHIELFEASTGIYGYANISNSWLEAENYAIGGSSTSLYGTIDSCDITGKIGISKSIFKNSTVKGSVSIGESIIDNVIVNGIATIVSSAINNVDFRLSIDSEYSTYTYCSFSDSINSEIDWISYSEFDNSTMGSFGESSIYYSNMLNCGDIRITSTRSTREVLNYKENFWGYDKTRMIEESTDGNIDFIYDYLDDFNLSKADYTGYKEEPIVGVGYQGDSFSPIDFAGKEYKIGDIGPAGGMIFFVDENDEYPDFDYLEMNAGYEGIGQYAFGYYCDSDNGTNKVVGTGTGIGEGKSNTEKLVASMGDSAYLEISRNEKGVYAAKKAYDYEQGGYDDWFLPSLEELDLIYRNVKVPNLCSLDDGTYWSSSEYDESRAWSEYFASDYQGSYARDDGEYVRPCRAF